MIKRRRLAHTGVISHGTSLYRALEKADLLDGSQVGDQGCCRDYTIIEHFVAHTVSFTCAEYRCLQSDSCAICPMKHPLASYENHVRYGTGCLDRGGCL
jgi:hypothetical protein